VPSAGLLRYLQKLYFCSRTPAAGAPPEAPPEAKKELGSFSSRKVLLETFGVKKIKNKNPVHKN
jgi:hypothetical protein